MWIGALSPSLILVHYVAGEISLWHMSSKPVSGQLRFGKPQIRNQLPAWRVDHRYSMPEAFLGSSAGITSASRSPPWLPSGRRCQGRRLSQRVRKSFYAASARTRAAWGHRLERRPPRRTCKLQFIHPAQQQIKCHFACCATCNV